MMSTQVKRLAGAAILLFGLLACWGSADETEEALQFARKTLAFVERSATRPELAAELAALEKRFAQVGRDGAVVGNELLLQVRRLRRRIILSHPLLDFDKLLINKRPTPGYSHQSRQYLGRYSCPGPGLVILESWKDAPKETLLLEGKLPVGSVLHPDLSFDARRVLFSFCDHTVRDPDQRRFLIYEVGIDGSGLRQLTGTPDDRPAGPDGRQTALIEDFDPCYLPGGGLAFVSTRVQLHVRCHYGGRYFANFVLYRADGDGSNIRRISFGEAPEWDPSVLPDGRIVYTRWDYVNRHDTLFQGLWVTRPDGTAAAHVYGNYTRNPCTTAEPRIIPGSHKIMTTAVAHHAYTAGSIIVVDPHRGEDGQTPITRLTPEVAFPETEEWPVGAYANPYPLSEALVLVAYTPDKLTKEEGKPPGEPKPVQRAGAYGIYLVDALGGRELIYRDPNMSCFAPIPIAPRSTPPVLPSSVESKRAETTGTFYVENVYRSTESIPRGSIKSLRLVQLFGQTIETPPNRGKVMFDMPKRILGTVPVGDDGSVAFHAPAGKPLLFQLLDGNGMAVMSMRSLVYLQPGEVVGCVGCHEPRSSVTPGITMPLGTIVRELRPPAGPRYEGGLSFARTVQPVLDRYCVECHGLDKTEGDVDLLGTLKEVPYHHNDPHGAMLVSHAYDSLMSRPGLVKIAPRNEETDYSKPKDYFAHAGRLAGVLLEGHKDQNGKPRVELDRESFQRIVDWLDMNAIYYGDYSWNKAEWREPSPDGETALRGYVAETFGQPLTGQPFAALVNTAHISESRILMAPLATSAGGWGQIEKGGWSDTNGPGYQQMRRLVEASIAPLRFHDIAGTCGREKCLCDNCWVRHVRVAESQE